MSITHEITILIAQALYEVPSLMNRMGDGHGASQHWHRPAGPARHVQLRARHHWRLRILPGVDGFTICRELRRQNAAVPILMLSARGVTEDRVRGLDSGADDYLTKPFEFAELSARIRALMRRGQTASALPLTVGDIYLDPVARVVMRGARRIDLTQKEFALLEYMMRNVDRWSAVPSYSRRKDLHHPAEWLSRHIQRSVRNRGALGKCGLIRAAKNRCN